MKKQIIIIDDDEEQVSEIIDKINFLFGDVEIITGNDGTFLLDYSTTNDPPDAIILDYFMPIMNGYSTAKYIREDWCDKVPIILITYDTEISSIRGQDYELFDDFILKPVSKGNLKDSLSPFINK